MDKKRIVIIGGGFGGLNAAKSLNKKDIEVILIDKTNHHLFQPLLYQVATAGLAPGYIATPIRSILKKQKNISVLMGNVTKIDKAKQIVYVDKEEISFDYLIVATGARHTYFGNDQWEEMAPGLKTLDDALKIRHKMLLAFEKAERCKTPEEQRALLTFVIVGSGPTGVELAGAFAEVAKKTMVEDFRKINPADSKIILVEAADRVLPPYPEDLSEKALRDLRELGVTVMLNTKVTEINENGVKLGDKFIESKNVIWAAGNKASSLLKSLEVPLDNAGRVLVEKDLSIPGSENIFVIGDAAAFIHQTGKPLPGVCPVAILQGKYVAKKIMAKIKNKPYKNFHYYDKGNLATIGKAKAVADFGFVRFSGFFAWVIWVFVHILFLIGFRNRIIVLFEWIWAYLTYQKSARLITQKADSA